MFEVTAYDSPHSVLQGKCTRIFQNISRAVDLRNIFILWHVTWELMSTQFLGVFAELRAVEVNQSDIVGDSTSSLLLFI